MTDGEISSRFSIDHSSKNSSSGALGEPTETRHMRERFFTSPTACPSGVSAGHTMPQWLLCSCLGLASLPSRPIGELSLRRWLSVDENDKRLSTCETPARISCAPCAPQLPVASEYFRPEVIVLALTAKVSWMSFPSQCTRWLYSLTSLVTFTEKLAEKHGNEGTGEVHPFVAEVIAVILLLATERAQQQPVHDVTQK